MAVAPGDTLRITAKDVSHATTGSVTTGLVGTARIERYETGVVLAGPAALVASGDDWYADLIAPATVGIYQIVVVLTVGGATRTLRDALYVQM